MNVADFIHYLQGLVDNRFILSGLSDEKFDQFHDKFLKSFNEKSISNHKIHQSNPAQDWYLIGTDGCHLCEDSYTLLTQIQLIHPNIPTIHVLDVIDASDEIINTMGRIVPLLLTPKQLLCHPFGVMDIVAACH